MRYAGAMTDDSIIKIRPHSVNGVMVDQTMLLPSAEAIVRQILAVPVGETRSLAELREALAQQYGAAATCPVTTQRMIKVVATRSVADHEAGRKAVPFWRVVDPDKPNAQRLPGGREFILARRKDEQI